ncbi:piggyBac transposable element-derived protein 4-like [Hydra vulgaris]|uniref:piggyBac transposable element-derived protein 4-like n=1 Tax=Hydra vulgaris TaxID=6087 RepID=UPI0032EA4CC3
MSDSEESFTEEESCTSEEYLSSSDDSLFDEGTIFFIEKLYTNLFNLNISPNLSICSFYFYVDSGSDDDAGVDDVLDLWLPVVGDDNGPNVFAFTGVPGPKHTISPESKPIDYVELFFTIEFLEKLVTYTNQYADAWIQRNQQHLRKTNLLEIKVFLAVVINMGLIKKASIKLYWDISHPCASTPWFVTHFNHDISIPNQQQLNKIYKVQYLVEHFNKKFFYFYIPQKDISIDESMIGYKGKTPHLRQYMPNKRHSRFGIKLWCVSDSTNGYLSQFEIYKGGKNPDEAVVAHGMTYNLVFHLLRQANLLHQGYHLGIDNYYTSPQLLLDLYLHQTTATGTVRVNRKGLPEICLKTKLKNKEVCQYR